LTTPIRRHVVGSDKKYYRALISIPISAASDSAAMDTAVKHAHSLMEDHCVIGHVESVFEVADKDLLAKGRSVHTEPGLARQVK
jgi:hypothetical protein